MKTLSPLEVQRAAILKSARMAIRLKHSLAADAELAQTIPRLEKEMDQATAMGKPYNWTPGEIFDEA